MQKDDVIYRHETIDALDKHIDTFDAIDTNYLSGLRTAMSILKEMPSAQPERKKGKWEIYIISMLDGDGCKCSECGFEGAPYWDYCPNCGCRMEGDEE